MKKKGRKKKSPKMVLPIVELFLVLTALVIAKYLLHVIDHQIGL
jgi:hypothetical protein